MKHKQYKLFISQKSVSIYAAQSKRCLLTLYNRVYDVSTFLEKHPGGKEFLMKYNGKQIDDVFLSNFPHYHSTKALKLLEKYKIGFIKGFKCNQQTEKVQELENFKQTLQIRIVSASIQELDEDNSIVQPPRLPINVKSSFKKILNNSESQSSPERSSRVQECYYDSKVFSPDHYYTNHFFREEEYYEDQEQNNFSIQKIPLLMPNFKQF